MTFRTLLPPPPPLAHFCLQSAALCLFSVTTWNLDSLASPFDVLTCVTLQNSKLLSFFFFFFLFCFFSIFVVYFLLFFFVVVFFFFFAYVPMLVERWSSRSNATHHCRYPPTRTECSWLHTPPFHNRLGRLFVDCKRGQQQQQEQITKPGAAT